MILYNYCDKRALFLARIIQCGCLSLEAVLSSLERQVEIFNSLACLTDNPIGFPERY
jgi:hypothetical protein